MFFFPRLSSFLPLSAFAVVALVAACSSKTNNTPAQECTTQAYPTLACGSIKALSRGLKEAAAAGDRPVHSIIVAALPTVSATFFPDVIA